MNELEEAVSILFEPLTQREYILNEQQTCNGCGKNRQLFLYSKKTGRILCADCVLKMIRKQMPKALKRETFKARKSSKDDREREAFKQIFEMRR